MNLLNWGEEGTDYVVEDEENGIINYPDGVTADNAGYSFNCGWELPNQFIAYKWDGSDPTSFLVRVEPSVTVSHRIFFRPGRVLFTN